MESRGCGCASSALGVNIWRLVRVALAIFRFHTQAHHGQVIVGLCTITMFLNLVGKRIDNLSGTFETGMPEDVKQTVVAKLLPGRVLSFVKTVGIDKQRTVLDAVNLLALIVQFIPEAYGRIGSKAS